MVQQRANFLLVTIVLINSGNLVETETVAPTSFLMQENAFNCEYGTWISSSVCIPKGYIKSEPPKAPTIVTTKIEINNIREVNDKKMRITIDFYQELEWRDNRLLVTLSPNTSSVFNNNLINETYEINLRR